MAPQDSGCMATVASVAGTQADDRHCLSHQLARGEPAAFWEVWEHHKPTLSRYCLQWMGGNHADAEDALSSASLRAWQYVSTHAPEITNVKAWLLRLLYNHCMSLQRSHQTYQRHMQRIQDTSSLTAVSSPSGDMSCEDAMVQGEMRMYMRHRIDILPPRLREPIILYFFQDMSQREIALHLNLTAANVRKRLQHARQLLRTQITLMSGHFC
jgi:RNA polymerase sigma-70 factor (ECF subfamily)